MKKQDEMSEITYMNYSNSTPWPDKDIWHDYTYKAIVSIVEQWLQKYTNSEMVLLNSGSGGTEYKTNARVIHLDIVEKYISQFDDYLVGSVEKIELPDESLDGIICVGSVINFLKKAHGSIKSIRLIYTLLLFFPNPFNNTFPTHLFKLILWYHIRNPNQNWNHKHTWHYRKMQPEEKCCTERIY